MDIKYLGFADRVEFSQEDLRTAGIEKPPKDGVVFTQGEGSVVTVTKTIGEYLISEHAPAFAEATDENRELTNASDTSRAPVSAGVAGGVPAAVTTGDTTTEGDAT